MDVAVCSRIAATAAAAAGAGAAGACSSNSSFCRCIDFSYHASTMPTLLKPRTLMYPLTRTQLQEPAAEHMMALKPYRHTLMQLLLSRSTQQNLIIHPFLIDICNYYPHAQRNRHPVLHAFVLERDSHVHTSFQAAHTLNPRPRPHGNFRHMPLSVTGHSQLPQAPLPVAEACPAPSVPSSP